MEACTRPKNTNAEEMSKCRRAKQACFHDVWVKKAYHVRTCETVALFLIQDKALVVVVRNVLVEAQGVLVDHWQPAQGRPLLSMDSAVHSGPLMHHAWHKPRLWFSAKGVSASTALKAQIRFCLPPSLQRALGAHCTPNEKQQGICNRHP